MVTDISDFLNVKQGVKTKAFSLRANADVNIGNNGFREYLSSQVKKQLVKGFFLGVLATLSVLVVSYATIDEKIKKTLLKNDNK